MKLITKLDQIAATAPCSLALGTFDGLHRGHMAVIHAAAAPGPGLEYWEPAVFTFESSPFGSLLRGDAPRQGAAAGNGGDPQAVQHALFRGQGDGGPHGLRRRFSSANAGPKGSAAERISGLAGGRLGTFPCCSVSAWKTEWSFSWFLPCWRMEKR